MIKGQLAQQKNYDLQKFLLKKKYRSTINLYNKDLRSFICMCICVIALSSRGAPCPPVYALARWGWGYPDPSVLGRSGDLKYSKRVKIID